MKIPDGMPKTLQDAAISLSALGIPGYAWSIKNTLHVLEWLNRSPNLIVLGGDLYTLAGDKIIPRSESWYYNRTDPQLDHDESISKAMVYLQKLNTDNNKDIVVDLVVE